jgi:hypothetical protein
MVTAWLQKTLSFTSHTSETAAQQSTCNKLSTEPKSNIPPPKNKNKKKNQRDSIHK